MRDRAAVVAAMAAALSLATGCARDDRERKHDRAMAVSVCERIPATEVGRAAGFTVRDTDRSDPRCTYRGASALELVTIEVDPSDGELLIKGARAGMGLAGGEQPVTGIADEAYFGVADSMLYLRKGHVFASIDLRALSSPHAAGLALGRVVAAHLTP